MRPTASRLAWLALLATLLLGIGWGAHAPHSWDVDNIAPGSVLRAMAARFGPGWSSSYGPVPYVLVAIPYAPILLVQRVTGELAAPRPDYPWGYRHPEFSIGVLIVAARLVCVALAVLLAWLAARERWSGTPRDRWLAPLLLIGAPAFVFYSRTSNVDMFYLGALALAVHLAEREGRPRLAFGALVAAVAAVCCKEQAAPVALVAGIAAGWRALAREPDPAARARFAGAFVLVGALTYALLWGLPWNASGWWAHHRFLFEQARYPREYPATPAGFLALALRAAALLPVTVGWPVVVGVVFAPLRRGARSGLAFRGFAVALYAVGFLGAIGYVYPRFLLPVVLLALPLAIRGWSAALDRAGSLAPLVVAALLAMSACGGPMLGIVQWRDTRVRAAEWLSAHVEPGASVELVGNPRFQARVPAGYRLTALSADSLRRSPRGPRADVVLMSGFDRYAVDSDAMLRQVWTDSLLAPDGRYRLVADIPPPRWAGSLRGLPVSPVIWIWSRRGAAGVR